MVRRSFFRKHWIIIVAALIGTEVGPRVVGLPGGLLGGSMGPLVMMFVGLAGFYICTGAISWLLMQIPKYLYRGECDL